MRMPGSWPQCAGEEPRPWFTHTTLAPTAWRRERGRSDQYTVIIQPAEFGASLPDSPTRSLILGRSFLCIGFLFCKMEIRAEVISWDSVSDCKVPEDCVSPEEAWGACQLLAVHSRPGNQGGRRRCADHQPRGQQRLC